MVQIKQTMEIALCAALNAASTFVAESLLKSGVPTVVEFRSLCTAGLELAKENLSVSAGNHATLENLALIESKKCNLVAYMGMIKGKCTQGGMKAREIFDLGNVLKTIAPKEDFVLSEDKCMAACMVIVKTFPTKLAAQIASYVVPADITKEQVLEVFSAREEQLIKEISDAVFKAVDGVINELKTKLESP